MPGPVAVELVGAGAGERRWLLSSYSCGLNFSRFLILILVYCIIIITINILLLFINSKY